MLKSITLKLKSILFNYIFYIISSNYIRQCRDILFKIKNRIICFNYSLKEFIYLIY